LLVPGQPPIVWKKWNVGRPLEDFGDDGIPDFVDTGRDWRILVSSGTDGRLLAYHRLDAWDQVTGLPIGDVNSDGTVDILTHHPRFLQMAAHSGRDGSTIWNTPKDKRANARGNVIDEWGQWGSFQYPQAKVATLRPIGPPDILAVFYDRKENQSRGFTISVYSAFDGGLRFEVPTIMGYGAGIVPHDPSPQDVNRDGMADLVVWIPR